MSFTSAGLDEYLKTLLGAKGDLAAFLPEILLCTGIVALLLAQLFTNGKVHMSWLALLFTGVALWISMSAFSANVAPRETFQGLLRVDWMSAYFKVFLLSFTFLLILLTQMTRIPDAEDSSDFYVLLLGGTLGMSLMASVNNLLMMFLAVEMASVPSYALAGFLKGRRQSSEAALKYVVFGGAAAGVMLYGISLLAGIFGTLHLPTLGNAILTRFAAGGAQPLDVALLLAFSLTLVGLAFKLSAVPFHFWCPDVFEGAPAEIGAFLSVASKAAAVALLVRFTSALVGQTPDSTVADWTPAIQAVGKYVSPSLAIIAAITCTYGNLAAYAQTNVKRLLAYSTIAHAGYMLMGLVPMTERGSEAVFFYLFVYLFMNLGAFAVVAFVRNRTGKETFDAYEGLIYRSPWLAISMSVFLLSLVGVPPLAGFPGKFLIFAELYRTGWYSLLLIGGLNTVISLVYYVQLMKTMILRGEPGLAGSFESGGQRTYAAVMAAGVVWFGIFFNAPLNWASLGAKGLVNPGQKVTKTKLADDRSTNSPTRDLAAAHTTNSVTQEASP